MGITLQFCEWVTCSFLSPGSDKPEKLYDQSVIYRHVASNISENK